MDVEEISPIGNKETFIEKSFEMPNQFYNNKGKSIGNGISMKNSYCSSNDNSFVSTYKRKQPKEIAIPENNFEVQDNKPNPQKHLKSVKLEIPLESYSSNQKGKTLAEFFQEKKQKLAKKIDKNIDKKSKKKKRELTKEDLAECKKEAMNYGKIEKRVDQDEDKELRTLQQMNQDHESKKGPPPELLERLAHGIKPKIDRKEMYALTRKNYENLPEIKQKKTAGEEREKMNNRLKDQKERMKKFDEVNY